ncbi:MAG: prephenate dehydratase [Candidatus Marinimicrobia bacterium]|nr:prephenate dehydratase [Candidatus Neomarinimicrobiota bacterium]
MANSLAYFGPAGTFTEEAAILYDPRADLRPYPTIAAVGQAVSSQATDQGVVPIENSLEGSVTFTLDLLIRDSGLSIYDEVVLPIHHYLMAKPSTQEADIQVIYSHPQSLAQCREFLESRFPNAEKMASLSNSAAVSDMKESALPAAAIAPRGTAELYNVEIIGAEVQDVAKNVTRFAVLARQDHAPTGDDKTSICFSFENDEPGILYRSMSEFAERNINLVKIESRPTRQSLGEYIFLIDCDGHRQDPLVKDALDAVAKRVSTLKILGSYPRWSPSK